MRRRGLITLAAVAPMWVALCVAAKGLEIKQVGWSTVLSPQTEHVKTGFFVVAFSTILGFILLAADFVEWLRRKSKSHD